MTDSPSSPRADAAEIVAIDCHYVRPAVAASHLVVVDGHAAFVDTGTTHSVPRLLECLRRHGLERGQVDYVLLTHVHLDHAGGAGRLMQELPRAKCVVHPRGARHMIDPAKLIAASREVYGDETFERLYGDIPAIPAERVIVAEDGDTIALARREFELVHTRGHALHHYCIVDREQQIIFSGDSFGISYREFDTARGPFIFPTTTPVQFDPDAAHESIDRLMGYRPRAIYLTHFSRVEDLARLAQDMHDCLDAFVAVARRNAGASDRSSRIKRDLFDFLDRRLDAHGYRGDAERRHEWLDMDVELNTQGLEVWLDKQG